MNFGVRIFNKKSILTDWTIKIFRLSNGVWISVLMTAPFSHFIESYPKCFASYHFQLQQTEWGCSWYTDLQFRMEILLLMYQYSVTTTLISYITLSNFEILQYTWNSIGTLRLYRSLLDFGVNFGKNASIMEECVHSIDLMIMST